MPPINNAALAIIKSFEGDVLHVYNDPATGGAPLTAGYGHTGPEVDALGLGAPITQEHADAWLASDLARFEQGVNDLCAVDLTLNQFSALVSFAYNVGLCALAESTLMRLVNAGHFSAAADQFGLWVWGAGRVMPGLVRRRAAEKALFVTP